MNQDTKTCGDCEYFDRFTDDCLNSNGTRFQTTGANEACIAFYPDTTARTCLACGSPADVNHCGH
ncbi:hypothetical protein P3T40_003414 [Paraburkholderia sp. EB58]|uniref:hypothetical protein n=1 Tax=Paraburkholderia sp. EB58 TaxID=3035125 RepID=UPI003D1BEE22